jgi:hypothetical protein
MGRRTKSSGEEQPELAAAPRLPEAPTAAPGGSATGQGIVEYRAPDGSATGQSKWRVEKWDLLRAEFPQLDEARLPEFHAFLAQFARPWLIVRRLFGITPVARSLEGDPDDHRPWSRAEICAQLNIPGDAELAQELEAARAGWAGRWTEDGGRKTVGNRETHETRETELVPETDEELLRRYGFSLTMFELPSRTKEENETERAWFASRLRQWEPLLARSPMTKTVAQQALNNELRIARDQAAFWAIDREEDPHPGPLPSDGRGSALTPTLSRRTGEGGAQKLEREKRRELLSKRIKDLETKYQEQLTQIAELAPWFNVTGEQIDQERAIADFVRLCQEYDADPVHLKVDGVFTAPEIQKLLQTSKQLPEPRYRIGFVWYVNESHRWLHDPGARSMFLNKHLAIFEAGFKRGVREFIEQTGEHVPDLERDGAAGEYEELYIPEGEPRMTRMGTDEAGTASEEDEME